MKKILILCLTTLFFISGCSENQISDEQQKVYDGFKDSLLNNGELISNNIPFKYSIEIDEKNGKYVYTVNVKEPRVSMSDIQMMILNPDDLNENYLSNTIGIFDDSPVYMIPNQANKKAKYLKKLSLQGVSTKKNFRVYALITWKDSNQLTQYQMFFSFNIVNGKNVKAGQ